MNASDIEVAVAYWFHPSKHIMVPNLSWGMLPFECDLAVLSGSGYLYEVEIKVSKADIIRDAKKHKWLYYDSLNKIRKLWFAIPESLSDAVDCIRPEAGILVVEPPNKTMIYGYINEIRKPKINVNAKKLSERDQLQFARLGAIRIWDLKFRLRQLQKNGNEHD